MKPLVFDCETDGLAYECTKIHVLSWTEDGRTFHSTNSYDRIRSLFRLHNLFVCHNVVCFDMVVLNRLLGLDLDYKSFADTLALSWYLFPERNKHGLAEWGNDLGVPKPKVDDWQNLTYEQYKYRCEEDVKINWLLWKKCEERLGELYASN